LTDFELYGAPEQFESKTTKIGQFAQFQHEIPDLGKAMPLLRIAVDAP
jgi:hypothetical protein